ncbi:LysO family transporter [Porphyromonas levii]|uniref:DUF340 domain-containing protein n=1 Tax=Porphyromonas levii TaxID=28114 RepID=A0A4Y8WPH7_9PORP|nr:LysO family transporter [Porphyromonas levii]MBR8702882.1 hypothetical protein [Porphyromonas levii]MBR8712564.1 hypothetical protein [Porphyromonas levii]MBR8714556.1 hypothetical protein [Porphyromonas levii]MBR8727163.1 hypothetical protein [Porphyromonas levii]MBR8730410.1 hypothetical protein [Porphyromonas levii]
MFKVVAFMLLGVGTGWLLRRWRMKWISQVTMLLICLLLIVLGAEVGWSRDGIDNVFVVVGSALLVAVLGITGSVLLTHILHRKEQK